MKASLVERPTYSSVSKGLIALGILTLATVALGARSVMAADIPAFVIGNIVHALIYAVVIWLVLTRPLGTRDLLLILGFAILFRAVSMTAPHGILTTDAYRYVWDGRMQWAGFNPFLLVPADPQLAHLRDAVIYPDLNQKETSTTIYPPVAQILFLIGNWISDSVAGAKAVMVAAEAVTVGAIVAWLKADNLPPERVVIYAWHPLTVWELASQAHIDAAAIAFMTLAVLAISRQRQGLAGGLLAAAALTKYFPVVLIPALWRRWDWRAPVVFVIVAGLLYLPYAWSAGTRVLGFLTSYLDNEGYGAGYGFHVIWLLRDFQIADPPAHLYLALALGGLAILALVTFFGRGRSELRVDYLVWLAAAFIWATSPHYPWYFCWVIPLLCRHAEPAVLAFTLAAVVQTMPGELTGWRSASVLYLFVFGSLPVAWIATLVWRRWQDRRLALTVDLRG